jgi:hypothetical protein
MPRPADGEPEAELSAAGGQTVVHPLLLVQVKVLAPCSDVRRYRAWP